MATFMIHEDEALKENAGPLAGGRSHAAAKQPLGGGSAAQLVQQQQQQQQRKTFGVLNNVQLGARAHAQKTSHVLVAGKPLTGAQLGQAAGQGDENAVHRHQLQLAAQSLAQKIAGSKQLRNQPDNEPPLLTAAAPKQPMQQQQQQPKVAMPVQPMRPFVPLDAFQAFSVYEDNETNPLQNDSLGSLLDGSIRNPLQELRADNLETPMSVGSEFQSPMSIEQHSKSAMSVTSCSDGASAAAAAVAHSEKEDAMRKQRDRFFEVNEYQVEILEYLREAELKHLPKCGYMRKQPDINQSMRTILVDWLVEVCEEYRMESETLCLAVSYIDRFLSTMSVVRAKLQLVGTAAMFIAAKYEEIYPPDVNEFVYITDHTYTKKQVLRMEQLILKVLTFDLFVPTSTVFVNLYATMNPQDERVKHLAAFMCELSLLEADPYLQYLPSLIAAGAMAMARRTIGLPMWPVALQRRCGYTLEALHDVCFHLARTLDGAPASQQQAIQDKYKTSKFLEVSTLTAAQPLDEAAFDEELACCQRDEPLSGAAATDADTDEEASSGDDHQQLQVVEDAVNTTGVREMISSLMFA